MKWRYVQGYFTSKTWHRVYRNNRIGAQHEVITRRNKDGSPGECKQYFFLDGDKREFRTEEALMRAVCEPPTK